MIKKETIKKYLDDLSSEEATPGGGSAAGVTGAMGIALALMAIRISDKRKAFQALSKEEQEKITNTIEKLENLQDKMLQASDLDEEVFTDYMTALHSKNEASLKKATTACFNVPYKLVLLCFDALSAIDIIAPYVASSLKSDLKMSYILVKAAIESCDVNLKINMTPLLDEASKVKYQSISRTIKESLK